MANKTKEQFTSINNAFEKSGDFIFKNQKGITYGIITVIIIVAAFFGYKYLYIAPLEQKAEAAIFKGEDYFGSENYEMALNGDKESYIGFINIAEKYSGTKTANLANAYAGICYAHLGKYSQALKYLDKFSGDDAMVAPEIIGATGNCYAAMNQLDKAVSKLHDAAVKADNNTLSPIYLLQAGLILEKQGKYSDAVNDYQKIKDKYFNSYQAMDIDKYIERATTLKK